MWRVVQTDDTLALGSCVYPYLWPHEGLRAAKPRPNNALGIHAWYDRARATAYGHALAAAFPSRLFIVGKVAGAGRIVEQTHGFRCERATPIRLDRGLWHDDNDTVGRIVGRLRQAYGLAATVEV